jgi:hypothetical protein
MRKHLYILFFILFGCTTKIDKSKEDVPKYLEYELKRLESIGIDNLDISLSYALQYTDSEFIYLTNLNFEEKICIYKLSLKSFKLKQLLEIEPDFKFEAYSIDEQYSKIYFFSGDELLVYNFNNELLSRQSFGSLKRGYLTNQNPIGFYPYIRNNVLFIEYFPNIQETFKSKLFYRQPLQAAVDLKSNSYKLLNMTYPREYQKKCFGYNFIPDRIIGYKNNHIITFPYNDSVYIYNNQGQLLNSAYFGTKPRNNFQFIPHKELNNLQQEVFDAFNKEMPHYGFSTFFSFSNIYCRQLIQYNEKAKKKNSTIVFYDVSWNYLGEIKTPGKMTLFDSKKYGLVKVQIRNSNLEIYEIKI